ncbi:unnamed protein product [Oppiella nova]|uniref:ABC transmembrane type-1 domain-containing protein n=1 Tax=Oppiella nova TaxID=334625 RepID=A0A7R9LU22_9ACAR|nr:unnamed protein product [Oppiella nova]CAG2167003.1 unnamed protein product [Oppiella nova]
MDEGAKIKRKSRWVFPVFMTGWRKNRLDVDDLFRCSRHDESQRIVQELEKHWNNERRKKSPKFWRALIMAFGKYHALPLAIFTLGECVVRICQPLLLGIVIDYFSKVKNGTYKHACVAAGALCFSTALFILLYHVALMLVMRMGMRLRASTSTLIYKKSLRLSQASLAKTTVGHIVNLMSNDITRFDAFSIDIFYLVVAPIQTAIAVYIMYTEIGYHCFVGVALLLLFVPFQAFMANLFSKVRNEVNRVRMACFLRVINLSVYLVASRIVVFACFIAYVLTGNLLTARAVFVTMTLFNTLRMTMTLQFPQAVAQGAELLVSCGRIQTFLELEEMDLNAINVDLDTNGKQWPQLSFNNISAKWSEDSPYPTLQNISLHLRPEDLLTVIGPVGAGKSSLLMAILNELPVLEGSIQTVGTISYASQESWSFNNSVRNNILFGSEYDEHRYRRVVHVCALERDLQIFPFRDKTLVGEKGVSLSGGQKARITLARYGIHGTGSLYDSPID